MDKMEKTKHEELLEFVNPLVDFMQVNGFNYFLVAGKDGTCTRHMKGYKSEMKDMMVGIPNYDVINEPLEKVLNEDAQLLAEL